MAKREPQEWRVVFHHAYTIQFDEYGERWHDYSQPIDARRSFTSEDTARGAAREIAERDANGTWVRLIHVHPVTKAETIVQEWHCGHEAPDPHMTPEEMAELKVEPVHQFTEADLPKGGVTVDILPETVESAPEGRIRQFLDAYISHQQFQETYNSRWIKTPVIYSHDGHDLTTADLLEVLDELKELRRG